MENLFGSICLSDIPKELIKESEKNGKKYLSVVVAARRSPSKYGYTHYIKVYAKKGEIPEGVNLYIGELKVSQFSQDESGQPLSSSPATESAPTQGGDLPF